jgi:hypothetical protein
MTTAGMLPGSVPLADGHLRMAIVIARQMSMPAARDLMALSQSLQEASATSRDRVVQTARRLEEMLRQLEGQAGAREWSNAERTALLTAILELGSRREYRDYISAEQAVMATELLMLDLDTAERNRPRLDALFKLVEDDEAYRPAQFVTAIEQLREALGMSGPAARR